jgi:chromosome segregation ATPase
MSSDEVKLILERLDRIESRQGNMETGILNLGARLGALETIVEERLQDTRPLWESVQTQLTEIRGDIRRLDKKIDTFNKRLMEVETDQRDIEERVENLEKKVS